jgi:hypothetical protein
MNERLSPNAEILRGEIVAGVHDEAINHEAARLDPELDEIIDRAGVRFSHANARALVRFALRMDRELGGRMLEACENSIGVYRVRDPRTD